MLKALLHAAIFDATCLATQSKNKTEYFSAPLKDMLHAATSSCDSLRFSSSRNQRTEERTGNSQQKLSTTYTMRGKLQQGMLHGAMLKVIAAIVTKS